MQRGSNGGFLSPNMWVRPHSTFHTLNIHHQVLSLPLGVYRGIYRDVSLADDSHAFIGKNAMSGSTKDVIASIIFIILGRSVKEYANK
jgi:hypothetical protein